MLQKFHPLFDTPQGRAQLDAIDARLETALRKNPGPLTEAAAWFAYRQERIVEPGIEGLIGPAAVYHFGDVVRYIGSAADTMAGHTFEMPTPAAKRPLVALSTLGKGYGWRYLRALQGLQDALHAAGIKPDAIERFNAGCSQFANEFEAQLSAAHCVNAQSENPNAAIEAVRMFARQMLAVCDWLEMTRESAGAMELRRLLGEAMETLSAPANLPEKRRSKKRNDWHC
ncbi:hypothetical protein [Polaromonas sp.]|uniref:hypothetical protein n=1 Tax=Polaromonas sp. TaxID=1869339 RepID=UPI0013BA0F98|nr:hypothetical protein [Polaromonas sp.]NDP61498.1 hypothetical protein [Polaromonas sp.]